MANKVWFWFMLGMFIGVVILSVMTVSKWKSDADFNRAAAKIYQQ